MPVLHPRRSRYESWSDPHSPHAGQVPLRSKQCQATETKLAAVASMWTFKVELAFLVDARGGVGFLTSFDLL